MLSRNSLFGALAVVIVGMAATSSPVRGNNVLDFSDVAPGTLSVFSPYQSQGFTLTSTSGGWVFNSPDTGNGGSQPVGNNPFYAGGQRPGGVRAGDDHVGANEWRSIFAFIHRPGAEFRF
jgi:hypothetical protein